MADDGGRLLVTLDARLNAFERQMKRAGVLADNATRDIESRFRKINPQIGTGVFQRLGSEGNALIPVLNRIAFAFAGVISVQKAFSALDTFTKIQNQLKVTGLEGEKLTAVYQALYASAQAQGAPLETTVQLYSRLAQAQKDLNASSPELLQFTNGVAQALKVQGTSATEASGALLQLSQALGGGKIQAEEYNSLLDGGRVILQTVAAGLEEAGGSVSKLTALVKDGQVSSEAFFRAFLAGLPQLESQAQSASTTISQANERVQNAFVNLIGALNNVGDVSGNTAKIIIGLADAIDKVTAAIPSYLEGLRKASDVANTVKGEGMNVFASDITDPAQWEKVLQLQNAKDTTKDLKTALESVAEARRKAIEGGPDEAARGRALTGLPKPEIKANVTPVSLKSFPVPDDGKGGGRKARTPAERNDFEDEIRQVREHTLRVQEETTAVGLSEGAQAKAKATAELLNAAKRQGLEISDELRAKIEKEAAAYGEAVQKLEDARARIQQINEFSSEFGQVLNNAFTDAIVNGEKLNVVLQNLLKQLAQMALNQAFRSLFDAPSGGGLSIFGSLIGGLFGGGGRAIGPGTSGFFHEGGLVGGMSGMTRGNVNPAAFIGAPRFHNGLMPDEMAAILKKGEVVLTPGQVRKAASASGSGSAVTVVQQNTFTGGVTASDVARMLPELKKQAIAGVRDAMARGKF